MRGVFSQVALCLLLVTASVIGASGTATADTGDFLSGQECQMRGLASMIPGFDIAQCQTPAQYQNATQADIYVDGLAIKDTLDQQKATTENNIESSRKLTWCRAKADTIESLESGENMSVALEEKNETVDSYYAGMQWNFLQTTNTTLYQIHYMSNVSQQMGAKAVRTNSLAGESSADYDTYWDPMYELRPGTIDEELIQPVNGQQNVTITEYGDVYYDGGSSGSYHFWSGRSGPESLHSGQIAVEDPETGERVEIYDNTEWPQVYDSILSTHEDMKAQTTEYTRQMYSEHEQGDFEDVDTQSLQSACSLSTLSTDTDSTGSYAELRAAIGLMGFDTDANTSFTVDYTPRADDGNLSSNSVRLEGGLMTDWKPNATDGEYRKGETYDTANADERVMFVAQTSNNSSMVDTGDGAQLEEFEGEFTIVSMRDASTGEEVNTTTTEDYNVQTANTSRTAQEVNRVLEYRNTTVNNYKTSSMPGGGGIPLPDGSSPEMLVILGSLIAAAYLVTKEK